MNRLKYRIRKKGRYWALLTPVNGYVVVTARTLEKLYVKAGPVIQRDYERRLRNARSY